MDSAPLTLDQLKRQLAVRSNELHALAMAKRRAANVYKVLASDLRSGADEAISTLVDSGELAVSIADKLSSSPLECVLTKLAPDEVEHLGKSIAAMIEERLRWLASQMVEHCDASASGNRDAEQQCVGARNEVEILRKHLDDARPVPSPPDLVPASIAEAQGT